MSVFLGVFPQLWTKDIRAISHLGKAHFYPQWITEETKGYFLIFSKSYPRISNIHMQTLRQTHAYRHNIHTLWVYHAVDSYLFVYHFIHLRLSSIYLHLLQCAVRCFHYSGHFYFERIQWKVQHTGADQPVYSSFKWLINAFSFTPSNHEDSLL